MGVTKGLVSPHSPAVQTLLTCNTISIAGFKLIDAFHKLLVRIVAFSGNASSWRDVSLTSQTISALHGNNAARARPRAVDSRLVQAWRDGDSREDEQETCGAHHPHHLCHQQAVSPADLGP